MSYETQQRVPVNAITVVMFISGWEKYQDLVILTSQKTAQVCLERIIDYVCANLASFTPMLERIASASEFNPYARDGVDEIIMRLGMDLYFAMVENTLFEFGPRDLPFQLHGIGPMRLYLRHLDI